MKVANKPDKLFTLIKRVDEQVSLFVRLSAADQNGTVRCISCNDKIFWTDSDCAHFKDRDNMATRYYLPNLAPACRTCNRHDHYNHIAAWEAKLTYDQASDLLMRSHSYEKFTRPELEEKLKEFAEKVKQIRKQKGL